MRRMRRRSERYKNKLVFSYALGSLAKRTRISIHPEVLFLFNLSLGAYCIQKKSNNRSLCLFLQYLGFRKAPKNLASLIFFPSLWLDDFYHKFAMSSTFC